MNKRSRLAALLGAGLLTFGVAGIAMADTLNSSFTSPHTLGDLPLGSETDCANQFPDLAAGEVGLQFQVGGANETDGTLDVTFTNPADIIHQDHGTATGGNVKWWVTITGDADTEIVSGSTSVTANAQGDDHLVVSHVCFGGNFEISGEPTTDITLQPTDVLSPSGTSGPSDSAWLLVVALGVLLASVVVLTPARAKGKR